MIKNSHEKQIMKTLRNTKKCLCSHIFVLLKNIYLFYNFFFTIFFFSQLPSAGIFSQLFLVPAGQHFANLFSGWVIYIVYIHAHTNTQTHTRVCMSFWGLEHEKPLGQWGLLKSCKNKTEMCLTNLYTNNLTCKWNLLFIAILAGCTTYVAQQFRLSFVLLWLHNASFISNQKQVLTAWRLVLCPQYFNMEPHCYIAWPFHVRIASDIPKAVNVHSKPVCIA